MRYESWWFVLSEDARFTMAYVNSRALKSGAWSCLYAHPISGPPAVETIENGFTSSQVSLSKYLILFVYYSSCKHVAYWCFHCPGSLC